MAQKVWEAHQTSKPQVTSLTCGFVLSRTDHGLRHGRAQRRARSLGHDAQVRQRAERGSHPFQQRRRRGPGPILGLPLTSRDRSELARVFDSDAMPSSRDAVALRDARGRRFQRLEFHGDAVLDVLVLAHEMSWRLRDERPDCCADGWFEPRDRSLAAISKRRSLASLADWVLGSTRSADLVEACVGACFGAAGWEGASGFVVQWVHPVHRASLPQEVHLDVASSRLARELGAAVVKAAATESVLAALPRAREGELSVARVALTTNQAKAGVAQEAGLTPPRQPSDESWSNRLEEHLGLICLNRDAEHAVHTARSLLSPVRV